MGALSKLEGTTVRAVNKKILHLKKKREVVSLSLSAKLTTKVDKII